MVAAVFGSVRHKGRTVNAEFEPRRGPATRITFP